MPRMNVGRTPLLVTCAWIAVAIAAGSCRSRDASDIDAASSASASASEQPAVSVSASASASSTVPSVPLELQRFTFTSKVRNKEPADTLEKAESGQRVWAHFAIRNRSGETRKIAVAFSVNGEKRTSLDLKIEPSWSFRTWGYVTLRKTDTEGELTVEALDEQGVPLASGKLPIVPKASKKKR